jgi:hypothetical protein
MVAVQTLGAALSAEVDRMRAEVDRQTGLPLLAKLDEPAARKAIDATMLSLRAANAARFAALHGPIQVRLRAVRCVRARSRCARRVYVGSGYIGVDRLGVCACVCARARVGVSLCGWMWMDAGGRCVWDG